MFDSLCRIVCSADKSANGNVERMNRSGVADPAGAGAAAVNSTLLRMEARRVTEGTGAIITNNQVVFTMSL